MRLISSVLVALLSVTALAGTCPAPGCPQEKKNCCQQVFDNNAAAYCSSPGGVTSCQNDLILVCCEKYSLTPRGYAGENCKEIQS
ncbi:hypothetical protein FQN57_000259 [Myotisia sp. PD_48]|nr:hypothetical protein FQN57_000259 [Myotisia sp. PD_48]